MIFRLISFALAILLGLQVVLATSSVPWGGAAMIFALLLIEGFAAIAEAIRKR